MIKSFEQKTGKKIIWQVGGGIRTEEDVERVIKQYGAQKIILGGAAIDRETENRYLSRLVKKYGAEKFIIDIAIGASNTEPSKKVLKKNGWKDDVELPFEDALKLLKNIGIKETIVTSKERDGMGQGPDLVLASYVQKYGFSVTASGGVSSVENCVNAFKAGLDNVVVGKALLDGKITLAEIQNSLNNSRSAKSTLLKRIIPCLDINNGRIVKGTNFIDLADAGNPILVAKKYNDEGADEIVILDIASSADGRPAFIQLIKDIANVVRVPLTVGGGVQAIEDIREYLAAGADKVSIGSAAIKTPELINQASEEFGSQCIVISVDPKWTENFWQIYIRGGKEPTGVGALDFARDMEKRGAGELLVNSIDRDGTKSGYDIPLLNAISKKVRIPIIASSGAGSMKDFLEVFRKTSIDAALAAGIFHSGEVLLPELKNYLKAEGINVRMVK